MNATWKVLLAAVAGGAFDAVIHSVQSDGVVDPKSLALSAVMGAVTGLAFAMKSPRQASTAIAPEPAPKPEEPPKQ